MAKKEIQVIVHYSENREACEQRIREAVAEWYAGVAENELEAMALGKEENSMAIEQLAARLREREQNGEILPEDPFFASAEQ